MRRGTLVLQASQTIAGYWLPRHLVAFRRTHPGIDLRLAIGNTAQAAAAIRDGAAELGFVEGAIDDPALITPTVARDSLVLVVSASHLWANRATVAIGDMATIEWVLREPGSGTRSAFEAYLCHHGLKTALPIALELPSNEAVGAAVEAGAGATVISASVAAPSLEAGLLHRLPLDLPDRSFDTVRHRDRPNSPAATALLDTITRALSAPIGSGVVLSQAPTSADQDEERP